MTKLYSNTIITIIIVSALAINSDAALCCNYGVSSEVAGKSCLEIVLMAPGCKGLSGNYWIDPNNAIPVEVYCDMSTLGGGWERVAHYDSQEGTSCPGNFDQLFIQPHDTCTHNYDPSNTVSRSAVFTPVAKTYSQVRGLIVSYRFGHGYGFNERHDLQFQSVDQLFLDGYSILINDSSNNFKHIHSIAYTRYTVIFYVPYLPLTCETFMPQDAMAQPALKGEYYCYVLDETDQLKSETITSPTRTFGDNYAGTCADFPDYCRDVNRYFLRTSGKELSSSESSVQLRSVSHAERVLYLTFLDLYVR